MKAMLHDLPAGLSLVFHCDEAVYARFNSLTKLCAEVLEVFDPASLTNRYPKHDGWALHEIVARQDEAVAFKLGYREDATTYYSWLGGVAPQWRGLGLAAVLMQTQHEWVREQGYSKVTTRTRPENDRMMSINSAAGFQDQGLIEKADGRLMRYFVKSLV